MRHQVESMRAHESFQFGFLFVLFCLDFSHNRISDDGATAIASLLRQKDKCRLRELDLRDNAIGPKVQIYPLDVEVIVLL